MAWWALCKRISYKNWKPFDMIGWYRQKLYEDWYNSLPEDYRAYLEEKERIESERRKEAINMAFRFVESQPMLREAWHETLEYLTK